MKENKLIRLAACITLLSVAFCSCAQESSETEEETTTSEETTTEEETTTTEETEISEETEPEQEEGMPDAYKAIVSDFITDVTSGVDRYAQGMLDSGNATEFNVTENNGIYLYNIGSYGGNNPADGYFFGYYGYELFDLNDDGNLEMMIMDTQLGEQKYCMYTLDQDGNAVRLFLVDVGGGAYLTDDGDIILGFEGGNRLERYELGSGEMHFVDGIVRGDGNISYIYSPDSGDEAAGIMLATLDDPEHITEEDYENWRDLAWTPFTGSSEFVSFDDFIAENPSDGEDTASGPAEGTLMCPEGNSVVLPGTSTTITLSGDLHFIEVEPDTLTSYDLVMSAYASDDFQMDIYYSNYGDVTTIYRELSISYQRTFSQNDYDFEVTDYEITTPDGTFTCEVIDVNASSQDNCFAFLSLGDADSRYVICMEASDISQIEAMVGMFS